MNQSSQMISTVKEMLLKPDFLFPFVASQHQFRTHYYGLTSASLLEYFFIDMFSSYLMMYDPVNKLELPPHGERGWDYGLNGYKVSHKVAKGIGPVSTLWDATISPGAEFNAEESIFYSLSEHQKKKGKLVFESHAIEIKPASESATNSEILPDKSIVITWRKSKDTWEILDLKHNSLNSTIPLDELISFRNIWRSLSHKISSEANKLEIYVLDTSDSKILAIGSEVKIEFDYFPGFYLFEKEDLRGITLVSNNRSNFLIPGPIIKENLSTCLMKDNFVHMPTWFGAFAPPKPPNLYLSQKQDYDNFFASIQRR
jgi:hypothetical protein